MLFIQNKSFFLQLIANSFTNKFQLRFQTNVTNSLPKIYKTKNTETFKKILTPELIYLNEVFKKYNYELKISGGAVRDLTLDQVPHDIDMATNALPNQMLEMFKKENIRVINLNGIKHGTVPVRIHDKVHTDLFKFNIY